MTHDSSNSKPPNPKPSDFAARPLRAALGRFVTGITLVTTCDAQGQPR